MDDDKKLKWWERSALGGTTNNSKRAAESSPALMNMDDDGKDDIGETKMRWWERSVLARTNKKSAQGDSAASVVDDDAEHDNVEPVPAVSKERRNVAGGVLARPGAVAVRGPGYRGDDDNDEVGDEEDISTVRGGTEGGENNDEDASDAPLKVDSYVVQAAVPKGPTDEEIRQRILASTPCAQPVATLGIEPKSPRTPSTVILAVVICFVVAAIAAIAVGVSVPLGTRSQQSDPTSQGQDDDKQYETSVYYYEWPSMIPAGVTAGHALLIDAFLEYNGTNVPVAGGWYDGIACRPAACLVSDESCVRGKFYSPGCCAGPDCPNETKCGAQCSPTDSCHLKDPTDSNCWMSECYTCDQKGGKELYSVEDLFIEIDCLEVGTAIRPENGQLYKWAVFCGPASQGYTDAANPDIGEYHCGAVRLGANFSADYGLLLASTFPCTFLAQAECGCGSDRQDAPDLNDQCPPGEDCPFMCEDAGPQNPRNLCRSFPGNISWWEGSNAFNRSWFNEGKQAPEYILEIDIKGVQL